jgi:hypothetical protein
MVISPRRTSMRMGSPVGADGAGVWMTHMVLEMNEG